MNTEKDYKVLRHLERFLDKVLSVPVGHGRYCNIKIEYLKPSVMYWTGEPRETLRMVIRVIDGWMPVGDWNALMEVDDHLRKIFDNEETRGARLYHLEMLVENFISKKTKYFDYPYVHVDKFRFL